jgi:hypothetical protein
MLQDAVRRASRTPLQVAAMAVLSLGCLLWVFGGDLRPAAVYVALPLFGLLMFLGTRPRTQHR